MPSTSQLNFRPAIRKIVIVADLGTLVPWTPASALNITTPASVSLKADTRASGDRIEVRAVARRGGVAHGPRGGAIAAGAAIGFVSAATAAAWAGAAPAPGMCWYSTDPSRTQGFWDYCQ